MRALIVSDVHGNHAALAAILAAEPHDIAICLGDLVGYGPEPGACVRWARAHARLAVQGNHDRALADGIAPGCGERFAWLADAAAPFGRTQVKGLAMDYLRARPRWALLELDGVRCMCVHATPADPLYRYVGPDADGWAREMRGVSADVVLVGHTHLQFELTIGGKRIVNPGSAGQPKDGDPRAAFAVLEDGEVRLGRVAYPVEETAGALERSTIDPWAAAGLAELLRTGRVPALAPPAHASITGDAAGAQFPRRPEVDARA